MRLLRRFPAMAFALVFLSIVALALAQQSITLLLVAGALAAISWYITEGPRGRSLPKWVSHILVIAVALYAAAELIQRVDDVHGVLGRFGLWLTLIKLYERQTARDHGHLLMLSFLLMLVACLQATGLLFSVILISYVTLGVYVLLLYQLYSAHERARHERRQATPSAAGAAALAAPLPPLKPIIGQHVAMNFRSLVAAVGIAGLLLGCVVFVTFPRGLLEDAIAVLKVPGSPPRVGFTDQVNLMHGGRITDSRRAVMTVQLLDQGGEPIQHYDALRLRGSVLDRYEGEGRWRPSRPGSERFDVKPTDYTALAPIESQPSRTLTQIVRSRTEPNAIFSLYLPVAVSADRTAELAYDKATQLVVMPERAFPPLTYRIQFQPTPTESAVEHLVEIRPPGDRHNLHRLRNDGVRALAHQVLEDAGYRFERPRINDDPVNYWRWARDVAHILARYLQSEEFHYTLNLDFTLPEIDGLPEDPIRHFLFEAKRGHCEYFASALVALCENMGVEARLVTGYLATEYNDMARRYDVLERNAHAWVEVRTGLKRWTAFDPTPPSAIQELTNEPATLAERLQSLYDRFDSMWSHNVLAFDSRTQKRLLERWDLQLTERLTTATAVVREWLLLANVAFSLGPAGSIYVGFVMLVLILAVIVLVKLLRRSRAIRRRAHLEHLRKSGVRGFWEIEYQRMLRDAGFYLEALEALSRRGLEKPQWMPPLAFAEDLARRQPAIAAALRELAGLFYRSRYGLKPLTAEEVALARRRIAELAAEENPAPSP